MSRNRIAATTVLASALALLPGVAHASAPHTICVRPRAGCAPTLAAAISAADDGDTIKLGAGHFDGGVTIDKSVHVVGAGPASTVIVGGGPVVTVTARPDGTLPSVSLAGLSLTGGTAVGDGVVGLGGGLYIPTAPDDTAGATVSLTHVWVHDNRATANRTSDSPNGVQCPGGLCPFALGAGGGIANFGWLTVMHSRIERNVADGRLSDADGGGVFTAVGYLTVRSSVVTDNHARPQDIGRFAEGGGIFVNSGDLRVTDTSVTGNSADLVTNWPVRAGGEVIDMNANSGAIHIGDGSQVTIERSRLARNSISAVDPYGEALAFDSALLSGDSTVAIDSTDIVHNVGYVNVATDQDVGFSGNAIEFDGPALLTRSRVSYNLQTSISHDGPAGAGNGLAVYDFYNNPRQVTVSDTEIIGNRSHAYSSTGAVTATGGGVINNSLLELNRVTIANNSARATGPSAIAQGGGVWNGVLLSGPPVQLTLRNSTITGNVVSTGSDGNEQGGGLYTSEPVTRNATTISGNRPDDVFDASAAHTAGTALARMAQARSARS